jgi:membrane protein
MVIDGWLKPSSYFYYLYDSSGLFNAYPSSLRSPIDKRPPSNKMINRKRVYLRGQTAQKPFDIPWRGWWDVVRRVFARLNDAHLSMLSAGVAFYAMLAVFPALAAIVSLYALLADPSDIQAHLLAVSSFFPTDVTNIFLTQLTSLSSRKQESLGIGLLSGVLVAIWSAHRGVNALVTAVTVAYREEETRNFLTLTFLTYLLTLGAVLLVVLTLSLMVGIPATLSLLPLPDWMVATAGLSGWLLFFSMSILSLGVLYRFASPRQPARWRWLSPGAFAGTAIWIAGSTAFSIYVSQFGAYNETYGALSAIMVLLMWFYVTSFAIVVGAALNAELEYQTMRDTTTGNPKPIGSRDAYVADNFSSNDEDSS